MTRSLPSVGHGSRACYQRGCRAPDCIAANRVYQREYRAGHRGTNSNRLPGLVLTGRPPVFQRSLFHTD